MSSDTPPMATSVAVTLARMEGKLDRMTDRLDAITKDQGDHETRIRALEVKPVVTTRTLYSSVLAVAAAASIIPVVNLLATH